MRIKKDPLTVYLDTECLLATTRHCLNHPAYKLDVFDGFRYVVYRPASGNVYLARYIKVPDERNPNGYSLELIAGYGKTVRMALLDFDLTACHKLGITPNSFYRLESH